MPDPTNQPAGCPFAPRCAYACDRCLKERPDLKPMSGTHKCACLRYDDPDFRIEREEAHV